MGFKEKLGDIADKIKDKDFQEDLKSDPTKAVEGITGIDLPNDKIDKVIDAAKDKFDDIVDKFKK
ncbi:MAG: hypothetical protein PUB97_06415 [Ruminococcus sp.]|nr:hypothetical protein [Ruminococcus sp.]